MTKADRQRLDELQEEMKRLAAGTPVAEPDGEKRPLGNAKLCPDTFGKAVAAKLHKVIAVQSVTPDKKTGKLYKGVNLMFSGLNTYIRAQGLNPYDVTEWLQQNGFELRYLKGQAFLFKSGDAPESKGSVDWSTV